MMGPTHVMGGVALWLAGCAAWGTTGQVVAGGCIAAGVGALAPDVDHRSAEAAKFTRGAGLVVAVAAVAVAGMQARHGHDNRQWLYLAYGGVAVGLLPWLLRPHGGGFRGITHSVWGLVAWTILMGAVVLAAGLPVWFGLAGWLGWCSHLALDAMTREGLRWAWPSQQRWGWFPGRVSMRTGGRKPFTKRRKGTRRRTRLGLEYVYVQPALVAVIAGAGWLLIHGGMR